jgi:DNA repair ATPase RecN
VHNRTVPITEQNNLHPKGGLIHMSRPKRSSPILAKADLRRSSLKSIDSQLDLGNGLTLAVLESDMETLRQLLEDYNTTLSALDALTTQVKAAERALKDRTEQMLLGVAAKFGKTSTEYKKAGGTIKSERKRPARRALEVAPV